MSRTVSSLHTTTPETERLLGLSDAVFAIAITFLALDLTDIPSSVMSASDVWSFLADTASNYLAYALCFLVVGFQWWRHHWMFRYIKRRSHPLVLLTFLLLSLVALLPYPVAIAGEGLGVGLAILMFNLPVMAIGLIMWATFELALAQHLTIPNMPKRVVVNARATLLDSPGVFGISSVFAAASWAFDNELLAHLAVACWALLLLENPVLNRFWPPADGAIEAEVEEEEEQAQVASRSTIARLRHGSDTDRLIFFNDGVYAIAVTILALRLRPPTPTGEITNNLIIDSIESQPWWPYFMTFWIISIFWSIHVRFFDRIKGVDSVLIWLNLIHLMIIAFMPFPTELLSQAGNTLPSELLYLSTLFLISASLMLMNQYAAWGGRIVARGDHATEAYRFARSAYSLGIFVVAMIVAVLIPNPAMANYVMLAFIPMDAILKRAFPNADSSEIDRDQLPNTR